MIKPSFSVLLGLFLGSTIALPVNAQIIPDSTTSTTVTLTGNSLRIAGGNRAGSNLFHSFSDFSALNGTETFFDNTNDIVNIFSRVTGGNISDLNGLIRTSGNANLFLINPAGIIFGLNSSLDIGGSFLNSTANSLIFADGTEFSALNLQSQPLLTINMPIALNLGNNSGEIVNRSVNGLQLKSSENIAFVGNGISFEQGNVSGNNGRIELGSVAGDNLVNLISLEQGLSLDFSEVTNFRDISLSNSSLMMNGENGAIQILGRNIELKDSQIILDPGGTLFIQAEQLIIDNNTASIPEPSVNMGLFALISFKAFSWIRFIKNQDISKN